MALFVAVLIVIGIVCFFLATMNVHSPRINLTAAGLLCFAIAYALKNWPG